MPHVSQFVHTMSEKRRATKENKVVPRQRSDLTIEEFGANTRYKDDSLSGRALSPHWNEKEQVCIISNFF